MHESMYNYCNNVGYKIYQNDIQDACKLDQALIHSKILSIIK